MKIVGLNETDLPYWKLAIVTVVYVLFSSFTALFLDQLYKVVAFTGALGGSMIEAIIPAAMQSQLMRMISRYIKYVHEINDPSKSIKTLYGSFFIVFGIIVAILGTYESVVAFIVSFSQSLLWVQNQTR